MTDFDQEKMEEIERKDQEEEEKRKQVEEEERKEKEEFEQLIAQTIQVKTTKRKKTKKILKEEKRQDFFLPLCFHFIVVLMVQRYIVVFKMPEKSYVK